MSIATVKNFDLNNYLGTWYEIARLPMKYQPKDSTDISAHIRMIVSGWMPV